MARYNGPKQRLQRQVGEDLGLKTNAVKSAKRITVRPGQHGAKGRRKLSNYGVQLKEKQKLKYMYGVLEKQLHALYVKAAKNPASTGSALLSFLERRLDNVVFRMGWAPTRTAARQMVTHSHVLVNNKKMNIPSYQVKVGDVISLKSSIESSPVVAELLKEEPSNLVKWLERKRNVGKIVRLPERDDIAEKVEEQLIIEYYSR